MVSQSFACRRHRNFCSFVTTVTVVEVAAESAMEAKYVVTTSKNGIAREKMIEDWHISCNGKGAAGSAATT